MNQGQADVVLSGRTSGIPFDEAAPLWTHCVEVNPSRQRIGENESEAEQIGRKRMNLVEGFLNESGLADEAYTAVCSAHEKIALLECIATGQVKRFSSELKITDIDDTGYYIWNAKYG